MTNACMMSNYLSAGENNDLKIIISISEKITSDADFEKFRLKREVSIVGKKGLLQMEPLQVHELKVGTTILEKNLTLERGDFANGIDFENEDPFPEDIAAIDKPVVLAIAKNALEKKKEFLERRALDIEWLNNLLQEPENIGGKPLTYQASTGKTLVDEKDI